MGSIPILSEAAGMVIFPCKKSTFSGLPERVLRASDEVLLRYDRAVPGLHTIRDVAALPVVLRTQRPECK